MAGHLVDLFDGKVVARVRQNGKCIVAAGF